MYSGMKLLLTNTCRVHIARPQKYQFESHVSKLQKNVRSRFCQLTRNGVSKIPQTTETRVFHFGILLAFSSIICSFKIPRQLSAFLSLLNSLSQLVASINVRSSPLKPYSPFGSEKIQEKGKEKKENLVS